MSILPPQDLITLRQTDVVTNLEDRMDSLKAATGLGGGGAHQKEAGGEEPVAGQKGPGTVEEPYDQGNAEGSDGAPAKEGTMGGGGLDDAKKKAEELLGKGS
ncbi:MAG: hypothetical protein ALECFALPRED_008072 [Alectoria fallacina]|uniref:Uncharacterized protein n=1 Tax=Alectoria fallacina TaxID=1903189 RepID=A0A8H3PFN5_9LECA|nr:MAG: hypothetical protein ALECFALPRED_008072 [Alectoria fallacina]